jgi:zeta-carotene desaturase
VRRVLEDLHHALPRSKGLQPIEARAIKEKQATMAITPGIDAWRPAAAASHASGRGIDNLLLAGDWCDTGWPSTMEGAVRSGYAAAAAVTGQPRFVAEMPTSILARTLGLR